MARIVFVGAGSTVFAQNLLGDIFSVAALGESTIVLYDIDRQRLNTSQVVAERIARTLAVHPTIVSTTNRQKALEGADYVICMIQVGGYRPSTVIDFEIPKKYGLRQTIGDSLGIGGIMRALRTIPVLLEICRDMEALCPDALFINYVNPMVMNCWAIDRASSIKSVGLCHSVPYTAQQLATDIAVPLEEINYLVAGINHMAFFLRLEHQGQDLYPRLRRFAASQQSPPIRDMDMADQVRYEMLSRLGYFVTESSEHFSEYVPWFIKRDRPDLIERFQIPLDEYLRRCQTQIDDWDRLRSSLEQRDQPLKVARSVEYSSHIIASMETGRPNIIYGNVPNQGIIDNLPTGVPVEVPCLVDKNGIQPITIGTLPPHLAALMQSNINVQTLTVEASLTGKREHIYHAAMLDPHTAAELDLDSIWSMVDELITAHGQWLPRFE